MTIPFGDQRREVAEIRDSVEAALGRVLDSGRFIDGPEVESFERQFAQWLGLPFVVGTASGTEAITLALRALGIGRGDEVIVPANTCVPTAAGAVGSGASVRFADCDPDTLTMSVESAEAALTARTRAIVPVHLYGSGADMLQLRDLADRHDLVVVEDCAQAIGTRILGKPAGSFAEAAAFSFYPTKNLGAYGDAGCVVTSDPDIDQRVREFRNYGYRKRDYSVELGLNSRLDPLQAAILSAKLGRVNSWNRRRSAIASRYTEALESLDACVPTIPDYVESAHHLVVFLTDERDRVRSQLQDCGIETAIHYPYPLHLQPALAHLGYRAGDFPHAEEACAKVVSLPGYPQLRDDEIDRVVDALGAALGGGT